jgi:opacity protein-like surface antigen
MLMGKGDLLRRWRLNMKKLLTTVALAMLFASPALAQTSSPPSTGWWNTRPDNSGFYAADNGSSAYAAATSGYSDDAVNGDTVGRDPDPNIRHQLMRDPPENME